MTAKKPASKVTKKTVKKVIKAELDKPKAVVTAKFTKGKKATAPAQPAKRGVAYHAYRKGSKTPKKMRLPK